jgi:NAD+ kinase
MRKRVAVIAHYERADVVTLIEQTMAWLAERGHEGWLLPDDGAELDLHHHADERPLTDAEVVVCLGGDGTMLRAVGALDGAPVPLLGVNFGQLGYLTEIEPSELIDALGRVLGDGTDAWHLDERLMLTATARRDGKDLGQWRALNEVVVEKHAAGHTVSLLARIDGEPFTSFAADGLIVATPTGSTAYSLSARGPVVSPRHRALLLTPVSPHMLFDRTLVLEPDAVVTLTVAGGRPANLSVDGRLLGELQVGDSISCTASSHSARFVVFGRRDFHGILKAKFQLGDR